MTSNFGDTIKKITFYQHKQRNSTFAIISEYHMNTHSQFTWLFKVTSWSQSRFRRHCIMFARYRWHINFRRTNIFALCRCQSNYHGHCPNCHCQHYWAETRNHHHADTACSGLYDDAVKHHCVRSSVPLCFATTVRGTGSKLEDSLFNFGALSTTWLPTSIDGSWVQPLTP